MKGERFGKRECLTGICECARGSARFLPEVIWEGEGMSNTPERERTGDDSNTGCGVFFGGGYRENWEVNRTTVGWHVLRVGSTCTSEGNKMTARSRGTCAGMPVRA